MHKNIFSIAFYLLLFSSCGNKPSPQDILENISKQMCGCIETNNYKNAAQIGPCYDEIFIKNGIAIMDFYNTKKLSESQLDEFTNKIAVKTLKNCNYIKNNFPSGMVGETRTKQTNIDCSDLKNGDFYYLTQRPDSKILDTTFVTISGDNYLEKMRNRTTYSQLKINWKSNCKYELVFEESNDPFKKEMIKKGDILNYEIVANEDKSFFVEIDWEGTVYQYQIFKFK